jgi:autotransporter-associated beta strand protein
MPVALGLLGPLCLLPISSARADTYYLMPIEDNTPPVDWAYSRTIYTDAAGGYGPLTVYNWAENDPYGGYGSDPGPQPGNTLDFQDYPGNSGHGGNGGGDTAVFQTWIDASGDHNLNFTGTYTVQIDNPLGSSLGGLEMLSSNASMQYVLTGDAISLGSSPYAYQGGEDPGTVGSIITGPDTIAPAADTQPDSGLDVIQNDIQLLNNLYISGTGLTLNGNIQGNYGITANMSGIGILTLGQQYSTYTGGVTIAAGYVLISNDGDLGVGGPLTFNWNGTGPEPQLLVQLDSTIYLSRPIVLDTDGTIYAGPGTFVTDFGNGTSPNITGPGALHLQGGGGFSLNQGGTWTGGTILEGAGVGSSASTTLEINLDFQLGPAGNTLTFNAPSQTPPTLEAVESFTLNHNIILSTAGVVEAASGVTLTVGSQISGAGLLYIAGPGTVALTNTANNYSGGTSISGGTLTISDPRALGSGPVTVGTGGVLSMTASGTITQPFVGQTAAQFLINSGLNVALSGQVSGAGIIKQGPGTLTLTNINNNYTSQTLLEAGTLAFADDRVLGSSAIPVSFEGGTLEATAPVSSARSFSGVGSSPINIVVDSGTFTANGVVGGSGNASALVASGAGTLILSNTVNNYAGGTTINGAVSVAYDSNLGNSDTGITFGSQLASHFFIVPGNLITTTTFATPRPITLGAFGGQFSPAAGTTFIVASAIGGGGTAGNGLILNGPGTLALATTPTYTGGTTINGGTLIPTGGLFGGGVNALGAITMNGGTLLLQQQSTYLPFILPLSVSGYNQDVVVEHTATPANFRTFITRGFDNANTNSGGFAFFESGYNGTNASGNAGLPQNHTFTSASTSLTEFTLPSYTGNNALILNSNGGTGTLTLSQHGSFGDISILAAGANGSASLNVTLDFTDGSSILASSLTVPDWFSSSTAAYTAVSRVSLSDGSVQTAAGGPKLYEEDITVPSGYTSKLLSGITFSNTTTAAGESVGIMAVSGYAPNQTYSNDVTVTADSTLDITGASIVSLGNLTLTSGKLSLATTNTRLLLLVNALTPGEGSLDLAGNDLVIHNGTLGTVSTPGSITAEIAQGRGTGTWTGAGITSSSAAASPTLTALGTLTGAQYLALNPSAQFDTQTISSTDVLVKYTFVGDADLSGTVGAADYLQIDSAYNYNSNPVNAAHLETGWSNGDFNYDGLINGDDYTLIDNAFNSQGTTTYAVASAGPAEMLATDTAQIAPTASVPEPMSVGLIGIALLKIRSRRRRRKTVCR